VISIKRFLDPESREAAEAFESMACRLLHAIGQHAVKVERSDFESFQTTIEGMEAGLKKDPSPENILVTAGSAVGVLESYNRRTSHSITAKSGELHAIVGILTQAMSQIASDSQRSIERLQELQKNIEHAAFVEDLRALKILLSDWVQSIQGEVRRQRDESNRAIADLKQSLRQSQEAKPSETVETGRALSLPPRLDAKAAIAAACEARSRTYAGLFVLDRFHATKARFGPALGEQVLEFFMQLLVQGIGPGDRLFRWGVSRM
jgi:GGDEF domain-containing protein